MTRTINLLPPMLCLALFPFLTAAQPGEYSFLKDDTLLRRQYANQSNEKKNALLAGLSNKYAKDYKTIYDDQFGNLSNFWNSTRPVTAPEVHDYLQAIVKKIVDANPALKTTDVRVVFSRDWWPNAVSMGDGTIAINAGLLIHLESEAELVFVICHELSHYYLQHTQNSIKRYVELINSESYQAELRRLSKQAYGTNKEVEDLARSVTFGSRRHSRDNEAAADRQAWLFMKNTGYDCRGIISTLSLLNRIDDSLFYKPVDPEKIFQFPDYPFKKKWIQEETSIFSKMKDDGLQTQQEKDSLRTHPDCTKRISLLADSIGLSPGGRKFIVNEDLFRKIKTDFFMEIMEECYREDQLSRNLYYGLILLDGADNRRLAVYSVIRCLNRIYERQKAHRFGTVIDVESKIYPPDYNLLLRMLNRIRLEEIANVAVQICRQYEKDMSGDEAFRKEWQKAVQFKSQ